MVLLRIVGYIYTGVNKDKLYLKSRGVQIVNVGYRATNYYLLNSGKATLLVDAGWPGTLPEFEHVLRRKGIAVNGINYVLATHYHPDHAGVVQALKGIGAKLIVLQEQLPYINQLKEYIKPGTRYSEITPDNNIIVSIVDSRSFLMRLGFKGQIIHTPGHSDDSVTLLLDTGEAFIGDLGPITLIGYENSQLTQSWQKLFAAGVKTIYPGHGPAGQKVKSM